MRCYLSLMVVLHVCKGQEINATVKIDPKGEPLEGNRTVEPERKKSEFRPSPQLESFFEFNKFPVPPALPEAKHLYNLPEKQSWSARVKFPTAPAPPEHPYQFYGGNAKFDEWNKFQEYEKKKEVVHREQFDFTAPVDTGHEIEKPHGDPWKKILKFLTAVIPIGLLISALTPTVITVQNVNGTQTRARAADKLNYLNSVGCEDRILCELVLSASASRNAERHVGNLLDTFTEEGRSVERAEEMRTVLEAVKKGDCRSIVCKDVKGNRRK